jgi:histidine phosphotransferase ChpT
MAQQRMDRFTVDAAAQASAPPSCLQLAMNGAVDLRVLELLTARLCHELSGPIAAISNGVELLAEEDPEPAASPATSFVRDAMALVSESARRAGGRLQFYRFAYGFGQGSAIVGLAPHELAIGLFGAGRIACDYAEGVRILSPDWQKLACNLLSVGAEMLPRGGCLVLTDRPLTLEAVGEGAALSSEMHAALTLATPIAELTTRTVQAHFTGLLAKALGCWVVGTSERGRVRLAASAAGP